MCKVDPTFPTVLRRASLQKTPGSSSSSCGSTGDLISTSEGNSPLGSPKPSRRVSWSGEVTFNEKELNFKSMDANEVQEVQKRMRAKHTRKSISRQCLSANRRFLQVYASPPTSRANHNQTAMQEPQEEKNALREARKMLEQEIDVVEEEKEQQQEVKEQ